MIDQNPRPSTVSKGTRESLSQFAARVLDQLRISAWLPATLLISGSYLIVLTRTQDAVWARVVDELLATRWETILLLALATTVGATLTQGFAFSFIRVLEGYWGRWVLRSPAGKVAVWLQARRRRSLKSRHARLIDKAMQRTHDAMVEDAKVGSIVAAVVVAKARAQSTKGVSASVLERAKKVRWLDYAPAPILNESGAVRSRFEEYPAPSRLLPTRLGNIMRSAEDRAFPGEQRVRTATLRIVDDLPASLAFQLRGHRNELDLYSTNIVVLVALSLLGVTLLWEFGRTVILTLTLLAAATAANYFALLASARGWSDVLIDSARVAKATESTSD